MSNIIWWTVKNIATVGFVGYLPVAPGTWGSLAALIFIAVFKFSAPVYVLVTVFVIAVGTVSAHEVEKPLGRKDPGLIVIDEFAGYLVSMMFLPQSAGYFFSAFILFRIFDILKPPPLKKLQELQGGMGVMLDDIAAGIYTNLILQLWRLLT